MISKKAAIVAFLATLLVACAIAATVIIVRNNKNSNSNVIESQRAIQELCGNTYYQETCINSLSKATNSSDPKTLIKVGFEVAIQELANAINQSSPFWAGSKDPSAAQAYKICQKVLDDSMRDLNRTFQDVNSYDTTIDIKKFVDDLQTWLTGALTFQETCMDALEEANAGEATKMRELLGVTRELTINGLTLVNDFSDFLVASSGRVSSSRRLMAQERGEEKWFERGEINRLLFGIPRTIEPNVVVAKDGSGKYKTINEALKDVPRNSNSTFVIHVKEGVYQEYVIFDSGMRNVMLVGDGPTKTKITGNKSKVGGVETYQTATVAIEGDNFVAKNIGFENSAGPQMHQAVAIRVTADQCAFYNCRFDGYQDTLLAHNHRQFYRESTITGTIDFIFGNARAIFQNCTMLVRKPLEEQKLCMVTAQGKEERNETSGFVIQNSRIGPSPEYPVADKTYKTFLGRPWKKYSTTIVMESDLDFLISPEGWSPWNETTANLDTCWYAEFNNAGPGSDTTQRAQWPGIKKASYKDARKFTVGEYLYGDSWIGGLGVPFVSGLSSG